MTRVIELYGHPTNSDPPGGWAAVGAAQRCPYLGQKCLKNRKSQPDQTIGSCTVAHGRAAQPVVVCPYRLLQRRQVFTDCILLLTRHEPGNELHLVTELALPGGNVDYCLASVRRGKPIDFVGIELQTLDTTGTVWPARQAFLRGKGVRLKPPAADTDFGMNWKMTAKTTLVQIHHKIETFEHVGRKLVLVIQDALLDYMRRKFAFAHLTPARVGDSMHFHSYRLAPAADGYRLELDQRLSTDGAGIARCLGLQAEANVEEGELFDQIERKLSDGTVLTVGGTNPVPAAPADVSE